MAGAAAGGDAGADGEAGALDADFGEGVEVGLFGRFELGFSAGSQGQAAEAVGDEHDDFGIVFDLELAGEGVGVHGGFRVRGSGFRGQCCCDRKQAARQGW